MHAQVEARKADEKRHAKGEKIEEIIPRSWHDFLPSKKEPQAEENGGDSGMPRGKTERAFGKEGERRARNVKKNFQDLAAERSGYSRNKNQEKITVAFLREENEKQKREKCGQDFGTDDVGDPFHETGERRAGRAEHMRADCTVDAL